MRQHEVSNTTFGRAMQVLRRIESIMEEEREDNWIRGIRVLIATIEQGSTDDVARQDALDAVRAAFKTMMCAKDGFGDYTIWRDNLQARIQANSELDALRTELWQLLVDKEDQA